MLAERFTDLLGLLILCCAGLRELRGGLLPVGAAAVDTRAIEQQVRGRLDSAVEAAVTKAVAASEVRQRRQTAELLQAAEQRHELDRRAILAAFSSQTGILQRQMGNIYMAANQMKAGE